MKAIFQHCEEWENCENEDIRNIQDKKIVGGKDFDSLTEDEIARLDKICSICKHALNIKEERCPICGNKNLEPTGFVDGSGTSTISLETYHYKCEKCCRELYSYGKIN